MHLGLNRPPVAFQDGSASWNASAADALATWNQYVDSVKFVEAGPVSPSGGDGANSIFFSNTIYGQAFGSSTLAVTINYSNLGSGVFTETDVIFNNARTWNSYRGPIQGSGAGATYDFHRVALHEFGHVLGLDHPDQHGQNVVALMNSTITDLDRLADDDIAGARSIYGLKLTSSLNPPAGRSGDNFAYQITANNNPSSYSATGLPAGLELGGGTGLISGRCSTSGTFPVDIVVQGALGTATGRVQIIIFPQPISSTSYVQFQVGDTISYQILAGNSPTSFGAIGLPAWLQVDSASGLISGVAQAAGTFDIRVTANSALSEAAGNVRIVVMPPRITSSLFSPPFDVGSNFSYQITASNQPTSFSASGLPAGLRLDPVTGKISGVAELSGQYQVTITAYGAVGLASATLLLTVQSLEVADPPLKKLPLYLNGGMVADPARPRLYAVTLDGLTVIDTNSLSVIQTIPGVFSHGDLSISADGSKLWVTGYYDSKIKRVDLNTLTVMDPITTMLLPNFIREGADGRLYVSDYNQQDVFQLDAGTGSVLSRFTPRTTTNSFVRCALETSSDRKTLYVLGLSSPILLGKYDVVGGNSPALVQRVESGELQSYGRKLAVNPNGASVSVISGSSKSGVVNPTLIRSAGDLNLIQASYTPSNPAGDVIYGPDGTLAFQTMQQRSRIDVFQTSNAQLVRTITLPDRAIPVDDSFGPRSMAVDKTNSYFFVASTSFTGAGLYVYSLAPPPKLATPAKSLLNVSTRLRAQGGDNALIGGFIISGQEAKQLALRAIGPSLPLTGKLADPVLSLYDSTGALVSRNDNWNSHRAEVIATGLAPADEHEAVITATLQPGSYTAVLRGVRDGVGVALVEAYDLTANSASKLANISTRGKVETGDNVMIGGFILGGDQSTTTVVRALGPSLTQFGVPGTLDDPTLAVHDGNGALLAQDDDWRMYQEQLLIDSGLAPTDNRESAMILWLNPGAYTAIVRGKDDGFGVGLVEVYNLDAK